MTSAPTIKRNLTPTREPTLIDVLNLNTTDLMLNFNCHHLATIQAFDADTQTVQVTINYKQTYLQYSGIAPVTQNVTVDYPIIQEVPLIVIGGGGCHVTFPVKVGDQCLLLFNDRDLNNWFTGSTNSPNQSTRLHSYSDAIALIGPNNLNTIIANYDAVRALITNGITKVGINPTNNKLTLTNGISLKTVLQNLTTQLEDLCSKIALITVTCATPGDPSSVPINAADFGIISTQISNIATQIGDLIE